MRWPWGSLSIHSILGFCEQPSLSFPSSPSLTHLGCSHPTDLLLGTKMSQVLQNFILSFPVPLPWPKLLTSSLAAPLGTGRGSKVSPEIFLFSRLSNLLEGRETRSQWSPLITPANSPRSVRVVGMGRGQGPLTPSAAFPGSEGEQGSSASPASSLLFPNTPLWSARVASAPALVFITRL